MLAKSLMTLAVLAVLVNFASAQALNVIDIVLNAPSRPQTCSPTTITWSWDYAGTMPDDPVTLSIINATDFGLGGSSSTERRRAFHRHFETEPRMQFRKRATIKGVTISGADAIPFSDGGYTWSQVKAYPGQYRLLMTVLSSSQSVVSDPFLVNGSDVSCLTTGAASPTSSSSTGNTISVTSSAGSSSEPTSSSASSHAPSSIPTLGASSSSSSGSTSASNSAGQADSSDSSGGSTNHGAIAAGVLVPLLAIAGAALGFLWYRKRKADTGTSGQGSSSPPAWSEKFFGGSGAGGEGSPAQGRSHHVRGISGPQAATSAGLAAVASMVPMELRRSKDHAALQAHGQQHPTLQRGSPETMSPTAGSWVDFGSEDAHNIAGPRPLSRDTIDSAHIGDYASTGVASSPVPEHTGAGLQLYAQGRNVPLGSRSSSMAPHDSISTFGTPADRASNVTQGSLGRDLIAAMPQPPSARSSRPSSLEQPQHNVSPFSDSAEAVDDAGRSASTDTEPGKAVLQRSGSSGSTFGIKRKAVPRLTIQGAPSTTPAVPVDAGEGTTIDPFSDGHNDVSVDMTPAAEDINTDAAYDDDAFEAVETMNALPDDSPVVPQTPDHSRPSPSSVPATPASVMSLNREVNMSSNEVSREGESAADVDRRADVNRDQYHLSINLSQDNGFRVSFG